MFLHVKVGNQFGIFVFVSNEAKQLSRIRDVSSPFSVLSHDFLLRPISATSDFSHHCELLKLVSAVSTLSKAKRHNIFIS